ncbi:MAG: hypothetical protein U5L09_05865 [Bacteroidales bacterium]|nr:hypothetical protein [Bacteroidales bacterium]
MASTAKGKETAAGSVEEVLHDKKTIEIAANNLEKLQSTLMSLKEVLSVTQENNKLIATVEGIILLQEALNKLLFEKNIVADITRLLRKKSLEKYFWIQPPINHKHHAAPFKYRTKETSEIQKTFLDTYRALLRINGPGIFWCFQGSINEVTRSTNTKSPVAIARNVALSISCMCGITSPF